MANIQSERKTMMMDSIYILSTHLRKDIPGWGILKRNLTADIEMILSVVCIQPTMSFIIPLQTDVDFIHLVEHRRTQT